jgi:circadian clock protein KaiC
VSKGLLRFQNSRPTLYGLEMHLVSMHKAIESFKPHNVVVDPISNLMTAASETEVKAMLSRLIDYLKMKEITALCTDLTSAEQSIERTDVGMSSLMDTWILLRNIEQSGERNRGLYILKSRGMPHSNQIREYVLSEQGFQFRDVYAGSGSVLTGSARTAQEAREVAEALERSQEIERKEREIARKKVETEAQIAALQAQFETDRCELERAIAKEKQRDVALAHGNRGMAVARGTDTAATQKLSGKRGRK